ncbi:MAG TPA: hypothetical protein VFW16_13895 [Streptosporangiaceae bacterium]|nr:hypothetical protein [Streptosporangiaceae bacterium]
MHPRRARRRASGHARAAIGRSAWLVALLMAAAAGCGGPGSPPATRTSVIACGTAKTAANVPVKVLVAKGHLACTRARAVVQAYAKAIRSGQAPGNGGGGPVSIKGWTCQGFATPVVLQTGKAARCARHGVEILEILPPPASPSASVSASSGSASSGS